MDPVLLGLVVAALLPVAAWAQGQKNAAVPPAAPASVPTVTQAPAQVVENSYLNGEVIRLDGALRMAPR